MNQRRFSSGWDEARVKDVITHYESKPEEEADAEDEAAFETAVQTVMEIPTALA